MKLKDMYKRFKELKKTLLKHCAICQFDYQIHVFDLWMNKYMSIGVAVLTFDNCETDRSLFALFYQPLDRRLWLSVCFVNFKWYF